MNEKLKAIFKQQYNITYQKARDLHDFIYNKKTDYDALESDMQISLVILLHKMWDECEIYKIMLKRMGEEID